MSLKDSELYDSTAYKIKKEFDDAFFKYQMYEMHPFLKSMENIAEEAVNSIQSVNNQLQSCKDEKDICKVEQNWLWSFLKVLQQEFSILVRLNQDYYTYTKC